MSIQTAPVGDTGVLAVFEQKIAEEIGAQVAALDAAVRAAKIPGVGETVPAFASLLVRYDPLLTDYNAVAGAVGALARRLPPPEPGAGRLVTIPVCYGGAYGPDLAFVAKHAGLTEAEVVRRHTGRDYRIYMLGFLPGFPYLGGLDPALCTPRLQTPRTAIPAGSVGIGGEQTGIYPVASPGGWQLIGRSDAPLFDVHREPPALLSPGTRVRFTPQRAASRPTAATAAALARAAREAAAVPARLGLHRGAEAGTTSRPALEALSPGPLALIEDAGRPGRASIGVSRSGVFDRGALQRANRAVGNPSGAAALEILLGPLALRAAAPTVVAVSGAQAPVRIGRGDEEVGDVELPADVSRERALALDPGDRIEVGPAADGLRLVLAVRGGITQVRRQDLADDELIEVLGARSRDTLSGLGPDPLQAGDLLLVGPERGLDAVPTAVVPAGTAPDGPEGTD